MTFQTVGIVKRTRSLIETSSWKPNTHLSNFSFSFWFDLFQSYSLVNSPLHVLYLSPSLFRIQVKVGKFWRIRKLCVRARKSAWIKMENSVFCCWRKNCGLLTSFSKLTYTFGCASKNSVHFYHRLKLKKSCWYQMTAKNSRLCEQLSIHHVDTR